MLLRSQGVPVAIGGQAREAVEASTRSVRPEVHGDARWRSSSADFHPAALRVFNGLFDAASKLRSFRLPELLCGFPREATMHAPVRYPVACNSPQAWATGALPHALWNLLGLKPDAETRSSTWCSLAVRVAPRSRSTPRCARAT